MFKRRNVNHIIFFCTFCLISGTGYASDSQAIHARYSYLDSDALWLLKSPKQTLFKEEQQYKIKAFINVGILHDELETGAEFEVKNARLPIFFNWGERSYARITIGLEPLSNRFGPAFADNSITTGPNIIRQQDTNLFDVWVQHDFSAAMRLRVGQDFVPYGLDSYTPGSMLRWCNFSDWASQVSARTKVHRDIGMQLYGQLDKFNYGVAILQGGGISRRDTGSGPGQYRLASDNNDKKDIAARLTWSSPIEGLTVGASIYRGKQGDDDLGSYLSVGGITDEQHTGIHTQYAMDQWYMSIEYNHSSIDNMIVPRTDGMLIRSGRGELDDVTLSLRYRLSKLLEPKFRYEKFDSSSDVGNQGDADRIKGFAAPHDSYVIGMNFNIKAHKGKRSVLMAEYIHIDEHNNASKTDNDRIELYWKLLI